MSATPKAWLFPLPLRAVPTDDPMSFRTMPAGATGVPHGPLHPGAFGFRRANHVHEGVDLYCDEGTMVTLVEDGTITAIEPFTGPNAIPPSPWWLDTLSVMVEGASGAVLYGEIEPLTGLAVGQRLSAGDPIGHVVRVLRNDKGRPMTMLHLELHAPGTTEAMEWVGARPESLRDPTPFLLAATESAGTSD